MNKSHIIEEIIRTAKENHGIPLGTGSFEKATGVKKTDWYGKYWAKWGDAVKEAGFKPNAMKSAYDKDYLIEQMILLIREVKRFPAQGDIKMKSFNTDGFPDHGTFNNRLGLKHEMVQKILSYCNGKSEYQDIVEMCNNVHDTHKIENEDEPKEDDIQLGYVYLMKSGKYYKIGKSDCVEKRHYELGVKLPEELKIIHKIKTDDPYGIEAYWHKRVEGKRKGGEWFDLLVNDVNAFKRRKVM